MEQSRRDDLESIGYVALYFLRGMLPWQSLKANDKKDKYERIKEKKLTTSIETLCKGYPNEFVKYLMYVRNLKFEEKPDYNFLRTMFKELFQKSGYKQDHQYDWVILGEKKEKLERKEEQKKEKNEDKEQDKELEKEKPVWAKMILTEFLIESVNLPLQPSLCLLSTE